MVPNETHSARDKTFTRNFLGLSLFIAMSLIGAEISVIEIIAITLPIIYQKTT